MSAAKKDVMQLRCPVCLMNGRDPDLRYDTPRAEYYCQTCCFSGQQQEVLDYYKVFRRKYKALNERVAIKTI